MKKKVFITLIFFIVLLSINVNSSPVSLPIIEHSCYTKYADKSYNASFIFEKPGEIINTTSLDNQDPTVKHITIKSFSDMCRYTVSPKSCYQCIIEKKYGLTQNNINDKDLDKNEGKFINIKIILGITIIALLIFLIYKLKTKHLKYIKNNKKFDGKRKRGKK